MRRGRRTWIYSCNIKPNQPTLALQFEVKPVDIPRTSFLPVEIVCIRICDIRYFWCFNTVSKALIRLDMFAFRLRQSSKMLKLFSVIIVVVMKFSLESFHPWSIQREFYGGGDGNFQIICEFLTEFFPLGCKETTINFWTNSFSNFVFDSRFWCNHYEFVGDSRCIALLVMIWSLRNSNTLAARFRNEWLEPPVRRQDPQHRGEIDKASPMRKNVEVENPSRKLFAAPTHTYVYSYASHLFAHTYLYSNHLFVFEVPVVELFCVSR